VSPEVDRSEVLALAMPPARRMLPVLGLGVLSSGSAVALLALSVWLLTRASEQPPILYLTFAIVGVRAFALGRAFFRYLERLSGHDAAFRTLGTLRVGIYRRLLRRSPDGLGDTRGGDLLARLVSDVDRMQDLPLRVVQPLATALVVGTASVIAVSLVHPGAGALLAATLVIAVVVAGYVHRRITVVADAELATLRGALTDALLDHLGRLDVLLAFDAERASRARIHELEQRIAHAAQRSAHGGGAVAAIVAVLSGAAVAGSLLLADGDLGLPLLATVVLVPIAVFDSAAAVPPALSAWRQVLASAERIASVVPSRIPAELPAAPLVARALPQAGARIRLQNVAVRWPGASEPAVRAVSFEAGPGDCVVVTGASGAGKTTLAHALVRFLDHTGRIELDGVDVRDLDPDDVRRSIGLCEQTPHLFDDSLRQNLLFARESATDAELLEALARVGLASWVAERGGLDARVGDRGALVSGGQAQRIALARALLAGFPILVLDEPTANVDAELADALLQDLIASAKDANRALVVISHVAVPAPLVTSRVAL
jgi:ATP-binding cassette subfamily C protein CydC